MLLEYQPETITPHFRALALNPIARIKDGRPFGYGTDYPIQMSAENVCHLYWRPSRLIVTRLEVTTSVYGSLTMSGYQAGGFRADSAIALIGGGGAVVTASQGMGGAFNPNLTGSCEFRGEAVCFADGSNGIWYPWIQAYAATHRTPNDLSAMSVKQPGAKEVGSFQLMGKFVAPLYQPAGQPYEISHAYIEIDFAPWRFSSQP